MTRLTSLFEMLEQTPNDPFLIYAIGLEMQKDNPQRTIELWEGIMEDFEDYLPVYYSLGKLYEDFEEIDLAKNVYERGILVAKKQENHKILKELQTALMNVDF
jgi:tetratricopeptide (TPR) repeat protein